MLLTLTVLSLLSVTLANATQRPGPIPLQKRAAIPLATLYPPHNISVPVDHFHNESIYEPHSDAMFNMRYHFDASNYKPGGPVIVLQGGETSIEGRLPYLQKGLIQQIAQVTGGIAVILEHRYYGTSMPTSNLSTENYRFLTTEQALADQAYFAANIKFPGMQDKNLTAPGTAYFAYGGSYAGAFVAFLRIQYPDLYWGSLSSSGVTEAIEDYWEYYEPIREYGPPDCIHTHQKFVAVVDTILTSGDNDTITTLKAAFNATTLTYNDDFANAIFGAMGYWQSLNWDPAVSDPTFYYYCGNVTSTTNLWQDETTGIDVAGLIRAGGYGNETETLANPMLNFIGWVTANFIETCAPETLDECLGYHNASSPMYADKSLSNYVYLSWPYQYCTEWGFLQSGSTVPPNIMPLISRLVTLDYNRLVCNLAFNLSGIPDTDRVNKYGGFNISYPRLAIIGGEVDPWRPATPLATLDVSDRLNGTSTASQPVILIQGAIHHWDENGLFPNETTSTLPPGPVRDAQAEEIQAVQEWMAEWRQHCVNQPGACNNP